MTVLDMGTEDLWEQEEGMVGGVGKGLKAEHGWYS